jgi:hypothetical protein
MLMHEIEGGSVSKKESGDLENGNRRMLVPKESMQPFAPRAAPDRP